MEKPSNSAETTAECQSDISIILNIAASEFSNNTASGRI